VKTCHLAALALVVAWYLIVPPWSGPGAFNAGAPLPAWLIFGSFDSASHCSTEQNRRVSNFHNAANVEARMRAFNEGLYAAARCVASDDPRLSN